MHELSIAMGIVDLVSEEAAKNNAVTIKEVELEVGEMAGVDIEALTFSLHVIMKQSILSSATIDIKKISTLAQCKDCKVRYQPENLYTPCPACHSSHTDIIHGKELRVKSILID